MLEIEEIHTYYGLSHILFGVSLQVNSGEVVCLLGRNGAGKTTTLRSIMGLTPPKQGTIKFKGEVITGKAPYLLARQGMGFVPDDRRIFADLSVGENLEIAVRKGTKGEGWAKEKVYTLFPALKNIEDRKGGCLSGGEQKMLAIGRALMCDPDLLLLDEPTEGLAPLIVVSLAETILKIGQENVTIFLADQNVNFARRIIHFGYIIDKGYIQIGAPMQEIWCDKELVCKYLAV